MRYVLKSKNFVLRPIRKSDKESLIKNVNSRDVYRYTLRIPYPYTKKDWEKWIKHSFYIRRKKKPNEINFVIDINGVVGGIGLMDIEGHKAEIGYWLGKKYWNRGIITKAVRLVTNFAFRNLKLNRIYAPIFIKNRASARVLEKNGYKREKILRSYHIKDGKAIDALFYAKVK